MTKNELKEIQYFLENLNINSDHFIDDMGVFESMLDWAKKKYREQGPNKLGKEYKEIWL